MNDITVPTMNLLLTNSTKQLDLEVGGFLIHGSFHLLVKVKQVAILEYQC